MQVQLQFWPAPLWLLMSNGVVEELSATDGLSGRKKKKKNKVNYFYRPQ